MLTSDMRMDEWLRLLDDRGSSDDPIYYGGEQTTPRQLSYRFEPMQRIANIRIEYHGGTPLRRIRGTAGGMLRERRRTIPCS